MSLWVVIPVKPFGSGKSRLADILGEDQRYRLNRNLLKLTLGEVSKLAGIDRIVVISRDLEALRIAEELCALGMNEEEESEGLNAALEQVTKAALAEGARGILILPTDLPKLHTEDLRILINLSKGNNIMVIAPDLREDGTNAMLLFPPGMVEYCYGPNSFVLHTQQARQKGLRVRICHNKSLEFDLDTPNDLINLLKETKFGLLFQEETP